jgi:prepilin-type N-terminal cleavage/methylation domain-containing protein
MPCELAKTESPQPGGIFVKGRAAFTLIELLVVVAIISLLVSICAPSLFKARELARLAVCKANLHHWGIALALYATDNDDWLLATPKLFGGRVPNTVYVYDANGPGQLSAERMAPYLPEVDFNQKIIGGLWFCPSVIYGDQKGPVTWHWTNWQYFHMHYSYFARVDQWAQREATRPQDLTGESLEPNRLVMSDQCFRWWVNGAWQYNHGLLGPSFFYGGYGGMMETGPPSLTGLNQLFGDGHVIWKPRGQFDPDAMERLDPSLGMVRGGMMDATFY